VQKPNSKLQMITSGAFIHTIERDWVVFEKQRVAGV
jgi:hypothetical protein